MGNSVRTALLVGLVNGFCIAVLGLSPFVTTLGMLSIVRGLGYVVSNGRGSFPSGPEAGYFYTLTSGVVFGLPAPFIYLVVLAAAMAAVLGALIIPLPPWLLDLGLAINLAAAVALLVVAAGLWAIFGLADEIRVGQRGGEAVGLVGVTGQLDE